MKKPQTDLRVSFCQAEFRRETVYQMEQDFNATKFYFALPTTYLQKKKGGTILVSHFYCLAETLKLIVLKLFKN